MEDIHRWNSIERQLLSNNGRWVAYQIRSVSEGDPTLLVYHAASKQTTRFDRAEAPIFSEDNNWLFFTIKPAIDSVRALKRKKVKTEDLPKDTLGILELSSGKMEKIARVKSFTIPEYWSDWAFIQLEASPKPKNTETAKPAVRDTTAASKPDSLPKPVEKKSKPKVENAENGTLLLVRQLSANKTDSIPFVTQFTIAKRAATLLFHTSGAGDEPKWVADSLTKQPGVYCQTLRSGPVKPLWRNKGKFKQLALDEQGLQAAFLADTDTTKAVLRPWVLAYADLQKRDTAQVIADNLSPFLPAQPAESARQGRWILSEHSQPLFNKAGNRLFFGIAPPEIEVDTTRLPEEMAKVEVWSSNAPYLYTVMNKRLKNDQKKAFPAVCFLKEQFRLASLANPFQQELRYSFTEHRDSDYALATNDEPYALSAQYLGKSAKDVYLLNIKTGAFQLVRSELDGDVYLSPEGNHLLWWSHADSAWYFRPVGVDVDPIQLTSNQISPFYDETTDVPDEPGPYGIAGWLEGENSVLLYDQYDIWNFSLYQRRAPFPMTNGRASRTIYRTIRLDREARNIHPDSLMLIHSFNKITKKEGYHLLHPTRGDFKTWMEQDLSFSRSPIKAKKGPAFLFTRQNFQSFPNLLYAPLFPDLASVGSSVPFEQISDVNPHQSEYRWPSIEMVQWISLMGDTLSGLLIKPAGFDASKKYPMIVNFYEKLSDGLHQHRAPNFGRSQISPVQYASRGYVVFMPDIPYRIGYPGESAYDAIMSGVTYLIQRGGIDAKRMALQGHSWGGYQTMYLLTRTNLFKCAEAGAAVGNMTSAYGGIRWESGLSRHFQYEHQQSRIGGSLWEKPMNYLENSPLFYLHKVETPVLLLHNDKDGAVPFEQGIELFTGLRRLQKPTWLLNYNDEPHWPVKLPNRIDFQTRMLQFFDHYLLGEPQPRWMKMGIPPIEKDLPSGLK